MTMTVSALQDYDMVSHLMQVFVEDLLSSLAGRFLHL